jgi:hypothetical protein
MSEEFRNSFVAFFQHVGPRPGPDFSLDRIDNSLGYTRGNLRWATLTEQNNNRTCGRRILVDGVTDCVAAHCRRLGIKPGTVLARIKAGASPKQALTTPVKQPRWGMRVL